MTSLTDHAPDTVAENPRSKSGFIKRVLTDARARMDAVLSALDTPPEPPKPIQLSDEQRAALDEIAACGPIHSLISYLSPRPGAHRGDPVVVMSGLYGATALPQDQFTALRESELVTAGGAITEQGRAAIAASPDLDFG